MNPENAIEVRNLSKSFKVQYDRARTLKDFLVTPRNKKSERHVVLKNVSLDIKKGETVGLVGANGTGKSTLLKLMTKIIYPNEGTVETSGKLTSLLELGAGFHQDFTGRENIYFNAAIFGLTKQEIDDRVDDIIEFSELGDAIDEPIRTYSSGMYMRLAFSVAINVDAEILLIDEILAVGDQHFQDKCYAKLRELKRSDKTIVIVSHSLEVLRDLCTRAIWIYKGEFRLDGDPSYVIDEYLKQLAIDNKVMKKKRIEDGHAKHKGEIWIDLPKDHSLVSLNATSSSQLFGWKLTDCEDGEFVVTICDQVVKTLPVNRQDVFDVYREEYSGYMDVDTIGWKADINWGDYADQVKDGILVVTATIRDGQKNIITEKNVSVVIDKEKH
jgi:ABC-type polysaccharide/polyol phosphate transport system, ATPase component